MIPSVLTRQLEKGLREYIRTTFPVSNPFFEGCIEQLLEQENVFKPPYFSVRLPFRKESGDNRWFEGVSLPFAPYSHQARAFDRLCATPSRSSLIATGTGSGKTECFLYPILEHCYQHRGENGIKAIIIYPMNALATDQAARIARLIHETPALKSDVSAGMYVGGISSGAYEGSRGMGPDTIITDRQTMRTTPPDILLTNYKMLDYLLTRPDDSGLWAANKADTLKFIAVDEFHTFDGAQGTDLACLLRRLKQRLSTPENHLCCVGTSATMGSKEAGQKMCAFAAQVFGEPFDEMAVITEDRLTAAEFLSEVEPDFPAMPSIRDLSRLESLLEAGDEAAFIRQAYESWFDRPTQSDVMAGDFRCALSNSLMTHYYFRVFMASLQANVVGTHRRMSGYEGFVQALKKDNLEFEKYTPDQIQLLVNSLLCLISHARKRAGERMEQFLDVHVQLWFRELRRLVASVSEKPKLKLSDDLNATQLRGMLPVVNCRDCGATGWVSKRNEDGFVRLSMLHDFYADYMASDTDICIMIPVEEFHEDVAYENRAYLCPDCMKLNESPACSECGREDQIKVFYNRPFYQDKRGRQNAACPICSSRGGMTFIGARNATLISAGISEIYGSRFNDDKKLLAFSDSVQDASHKAGFFNARTWRFNLRVAIQRYLLAGGAGQSLSEFVTGLCDYYQDKMSKEDFIATFIAPNQTWRRAFEHLLEYDRLPPDPKEVDFLMRAIKNRMMLETVYEYSFRCRLGRTLEKSGASIVGFDPEQLKPVLEKAYERLMNEVGGLRNVPLSDFESFAFGVLTKLKNSGGVLYHEFKNFIYNDGDNHYISNSKRNEFGKWMPGRIPSGKAPDFIRLSGTYMRKGGFSGLNKGSWYFKWAFKSLFKPFVNVTLTGESVVVDVYQLLLEELEKGGFLKKAQTKTGQTVFGLNPDRLTMMDSVVQLHCNRCGNALSVPSDHTGIFEGMHCHQSGCEGVYEPREAASNFFGRLYATGDICRIYAGEHTGLLNRVNREALERKFKSERGRQKSWHVNLLSCTPTLELGIDIGDLSSIILCSVPPTQAQFLQRVGRPGRRDGNAFSAVVSNIRPHDMYFYEDPQEMISGDIKAPRVFLNAPAVLERQFLAFCFDCWIKSGGNSVAIPRNISRVLANIERPEKKVFPYNLLDYIDHHLVTLFEDFKAMFRATFSQDDVDGLEPDSLKKLEEFAFGDNLQEGSIHHKLEKAFKDIKAERDSIRKQISRLNQLIKNVEKKPPDKTREEDLKNLNREKDSLAKVVVEISSKNIYNFLSDEGLLPNYAFPEAGVSLKAVIYRNLTSEHDGAEEAETQGSKKKRYAHYVYEYTRPAASALSEFAPDNAFYSQGRKMTVDQIDVNVSKPELWRLCPECSHAALASSVQNTATCPKCGAAGWRDNHQEKMMLRLRQVYATEEYTGSFSGDERDDRETKFYNKDLYVDVDPDNITLAYCIDDAQNPFGFEFAKKATLRDINFGEKTSQGQPLFVAGEEKVRKGFTICRHCGKLQQEKGRSSTKNHYYSCPAYNSATPGDYQEEVFLYREFDSEILRILIPATSIQLDDEVKHSFIAAIMLGLKEYFGSVDHLKATVSREASRGAEYHKNYLVIYDTVPGGTGYLKHLMKDPQTVFDMLQKAVDIMEACTCSSNPDHDGCYKCLFAYQFSRFQNAISKRTALSILKDIVKNRDNIVKINTIDDMDLKTLFESELEKMFVEALRRSKIVYSLEITRHVLNKREGYALKVDDYTYFLSQQVSLGPTEGVSVASRADFFIEPLDENNREFKPIAVFTDGFSHHRESVSDDFIKRIAIVNSGAFYVWSLSYDDVNGVLNPGEGMEERGVFHFSAVDLENLSKVKKTVSSKADLDLLKKKPFDLLMSILGNPSLIGDLRLLGFALSFVFAGRKDCTLKDLFSLVDDQSRDIFRGLPFFKGLGNELFCGIVSTACDRLKGYTLVDRTCFTERKSRILFVLDDEAVTAESEQTFKRSWNGFLKAYNLSQFQKRCLFLTKTGLKNSDFMRPGSLGGLAHSVKLSEAVVFDGEDSWESVLDDIIDEDARKLAEKMRQEGKECPDEAGFELVDEKGAVIAEAELVWKGKRLVYLREDQREFEGVFKDRGFEVLGGLSE